MQQTIESKSPQEIQLRDTNLDSTIELKVHPASPSPLEKGWRCYRKWAALIIILLLAPLIYIQLSKGFQATNRIAATIPLSTAQDFTYPVYCPISYYRGKNGFVGPINFKLGSGLSFAITSDYNYVIQPPTSPSDQANYNASRTYVVEARSMMDKNNKPILAYCGLARDYYGSCLSSTVVCSTPGPTFDLTIRESIDVIWVNSLNSGIIPPVPVGDITPCIDPSRSSDSFCRLMKKVNRTQTFADPAIMGASGSHSQVQITSVTWPFVTHVHGGEVRPVFDGNPLSWIDNSATGNLGLAAFSLTDNCYFSAFDSVDSSFVNYNPPNIALINQLTGSQAKNFKINRYPNQQNPGSLWYHDHAMHLTRYNVQSGLNGYYIIRDPVVEKQIGVDILNQKLIFLANRNNPLITDLTGLLPGLVYRFRFLNNNFDDTDNTVQRISFSYDSKCSDPLSQRQKFSIIGTDSSLFHQSIDNQVSFVIAQAERIDILIKFALGKSKFFICGDSNIYSLTADAPAPSPIGGSYNVLNVNLNNLLNNAYSTLANTLSAINKNTRTSINNVALNVPYTDLSLETNIAVKRMRPLMFYALNQTYSIHGRPDFHSGWSENPTLGTVEDWFIINTFGDMQHPIHVHLISFQVIKEYSLRTLTTPAASTCSLYELDFVLTAMKASSDSSLNSFKANTIVQGNINYNYLCDNLENIKGLGAMAKALSTIYPENYFDPVTKISGLDVLALTTATDRQSLSAFNISPAITQASPYKYVTDSGSPSFKPYYSRWKDTAYVDIYKVLQYRIRWTKANYTAADRAVGTYFHVPADQLREYPGFVYHCHILDHEDREMMRPIMVQLPANAQLNTATPCNTNAPSWTDKYNCINKRCGNANT